MLLQLTLCVSSLRHFNDTKHHFLKKLQQIFHQSSINKSVAVGVVNQFLLRKDLCCIIHLRPPGCMFSHFTLYVRNIIDWVWKLYVLPR